MPSTIPQYPIRGLTLTAPQGLCPVCEANLPIKQHRKRTVHGLDELLLLTLRDTGCDNPGCPRADLRYRPFQESTLALSSHQYGLDVVCAIGKMRFQDHFSFPRIFAELRQRGIPLCLMTVQYLFRDYLSLIACQAARTDGALRSRLQEQGAILPIIDGLQFGNGDPVLYLIFDALSKQLLFGKEFLARSSDDLAPFIAQLKELHLPLLGVVSDKEKALVPAIAKALPGVPHQYCQLHFIKNAAKPLEDDLLRPAGNRRPVTRRLACASSSRSAESSGLTYPPRTGKPSAENCFPTWPASAAPRPHADEAPTADASSRTSSNSPNAMPRDSFTATTTPAYLRPAT
jgi:hypothetical protein